VSKVLVTGGAGYIGSHAVRELRTQGHDVVVLDNLVYGHREIVDDVLGVELVVGDIADRDLLDRTLATYEFDAVMHFAADAYVGESVSDPGRYYRNNVAGTLTLLEAMVAHGVLALVFSSTCATYGVPDSVESTARGRMTIRCRGSLHQFVRRSPRASPAPPRALAGGATRSSGCCRS